MQIWMTRIWRGNFRGKRKQADRPRIYFLVLLMSLPVLLAYVIYGNPVKAVAPVVVNAQTVSGITGVYEKHIQGNYEIGLQKTVQNGETIQWIFHIKNISGQDQSVNVTRMYRFDHAGDRMGDRISFVIPAMKNGEEQTITAEQKDAVDPEKVYEYTFSYENEKIWSYEEKKNNPYLFLSNQWSPIEGTYLEAINTTNNQSCWMLNICPQLYRAKTYGSFQVSLQKIDREDESVECRFQVKNTGNTVTGKRYLNLFFYNYKRDKCAQRLAIPVLKMKKGETREFCVPLTGMGGLYAFDYTAYFEMSQNTDIAAAKRTGAMEYLDGYIALVTPALYRQTDIGMNSSFCNTVLLYDQYNKKMRIVYFRKYDLLEDEKNRVEKLYFFDSKGHMVTEFSMDDRDFAFDSVAWNANYTMEQLEGISYYGFSMDAKPPVTHVEAGDDIEAEDPGTEADLLRALTTKRNKIKLLWKKEEGRSYQIWRKSGKKGIYKRIKMVNSARGSYIDKNIPEGRVRYYYKVIAPEKDKTEQLLSEAEEVSAAVGWLATPQFSLKKKGNKGKVQIRFSYIEGSEAEVRIRTGGKEKKVIVKRKAFSKKNTCVVSCGKKRTVCYIRVRTWKVIKGKKRAGAFSNMKGIKL